MTSYSPDIAGKPFEISKTSEGLERADSSFWMGTILFRNHQNYNLLSRAVICRVILFVWCLHLVAVISPGQNDWSSPLKQCWTFSNPESSRNSLASDNENVFVPTSQGTIIALNQVNGSINWEADLGGNLETSLLVYNGDLFVSAVFGKGSSYPTKAVFRKINPDTGIPSWQYTGWNISSFLTGGGQTGPLVVADPDGTVVRLDALGKVVWKREYGTRITTDVVEFKQRLIFGTANKTLVIEDLAGNALISQINLKTIPEFVAVSNEGTVIVGDTRGTIYALEMEGLEMRWVITTGAGISNIDFYDNDLIVSSKDNFVYRISTANGRKIWKRKLAGRILGTVNIDKQHAVFLTSGASTALILNLDDGNLVNKFEFEEAFASGPVRIIDGFAVPTVSAVIAVTASKCNK